LPSLWSVYVSIKLTMRCALLGAVLSYTKILLKGTSLAMKKFLTFILVLAMVMSVSSVALATAPSDLQAVATNGGTIKLDSDVALDTSLLVEKDLTIDLNGNKIYPADSFTFVTKEQLKTGAGTAIGCNALIVVKRGATLTIMDSGTGGTITTKKADDTNIDKLFVGIQVTVFGEAADAPTATLNVQGGNIYGSSFGISGNGNRHDTAITVSGGKVEGGTTGIFHPQQGTLKISGGAITGGTGIEMRSGTLEVTSGSITANGTFTAPTSNGDGTSVNGAAIAVSQHTTNNPINVTIKGGTLTGPKALYVTDQEADPTGGAEELVTIGVSGGTFEGAVEVDDTGANSNGGANLSAKKFISDGTFPANLDSSLLADDSYTATITANNSDVSTVVGATEDKLKENLKEAVEELIADGTDADKIDVSVSAPASSNETVDFATGDLPGGVELRGDVKVNGNEPVGSDSLPMPTPELPQVTNKPSGNGISVKYNGGNSFSTSNPAVPTGVEIDGVPVTFNGTGSNFSVGCISSDAKWVTVRWNSTSVTTNFTPDGLVECTTVSIPKTGDMSIWAAIAQFLGF